jgi:non-heme chloroperoxidase
VVQTGKRVPALLKEAELVVIQGGSHAIPWTHSEQVNSALLQFIHTAAANTNRMAVGATM